MMVLTLAVSEGVDRGPSSGVGLTRHCWRSSTRRTVEEDISNVSYMLDRVYNIAEC
jgi:hypothetical protein